MSSPSTIELKYDGADVTDHAIVASTRFESQANAQLGSMDVLFKDTARALAFAAGKEFTCDIDGQRLWGGYVTIPSRLFAFPVVKTSDLSKVTQRQFRLVGVDYNVLFDKRVLHNPDDHVHQLPNFTKTRYDGDLIRNDLCPDFLDLDDDDIDFSTYVDDVVPPFDPLIESLAGKGAWLQQGSTWRQQMEDFAQFSGSVFYLKGNIGGGKDLHYHSLETVTAPWGFSDVPALAELDTSDTYIGFRELDAVEDGSVIVNDGLIWGGSEFAGSGQTVFSRRENAGSITDHGRWQLAETHFGEAGFKLQSGVDARAKVIVDGDPGSVGGDANRGLLYPQWSVTLTWFADKVPVSGGIPQHLKPGDIVPFRFYALGEGGTPLVLVLPLRSLSISFPAKPDEPNVSWVEFRGTFALQVNDPKTLWAFLRKAQKAAIAAAKPVIATATTTDTEAVYGTLYSGEFDAAPDGIETVFDLPSDFGYIAGTTRIFINGVFQRPGGVDYTESDPDNGEITFASAPDGADDLWILCRLTG